ncbi:MAG: hypothetical protein R2761_24900 [Acidimicrobiales bacterium]
MGRPGRLGRRHRPVAVVVAGALVAAACGSTTGGPGGGTATTDRSHDGGVGWTATDGSIVVGAEAGAPDLTVVLGTRPALVAPLGMAADAAERERVAAATGVALPVVRVFARWDSPFPTADQEALLDAGRLLHLSVRPRTDAGRTIGWGELAAAGPDTAVGEELDRWARAVGAAGERAAANGGRLYLTFNHEPETTESAGHGTEAEYRAAWRAVVARVRSAPGGSAVRTVLVLNRGTFASGAADAWWPGDDVVDVVGVDAYNWFDCQAAPGAAIRPWATPAELLAPALAFARAHGKPLAVPETASTEDPADPEAKAAWILDLARTLADPAIAPQIEYAAWFSGQDASWPRCRWAWDSSPASARAMAAALRWLTRP